MKKLRPYGQVMELLRRAGLRPTRQRLALARLLFDAGDRHVTAEKLHEEAIEADIPVSLATIYNTLHQFTAAGLLREIIVDAGRSYFDTNTSTHHHFFHEDNGHLEDIPGDKVVVAVLPPAPPGTLVRRVDIVVRLSTKENTTYNQ
ncbi:iron response transcriptional regulator IrrA [Defluviicoccus vanus]|uniref:Ferric uptake regulation protein n=1 Tax=Defluviicoccus vanus TaxID=111831 RepID=A0A7H1N6M5_9PROT|nr:Fur family transcriptional regulator [Defluviicoccus vanus]QNT71361.1 transcriptional repressor [Defluviicoccus vanus]